MFYPRPLIWQTTLARGTQGILVLRKELQVLRPRFRAIATHIMGPLDARFFDSTQ
jgi:hypothetical protein